MPAVLAGSLWLGACKRPGSSPASAPAQGGVQVEALAAANRFLEAWAVGNIAAGLEMLTPRLLSGTSKERLVAAISPAAGIEHTSFEIPAPGRKLSDGRIEFPVRLQFTFRGRLDSRTETQTGRMILSISPRGRWLVDEFPMP